MVVMFKINLHYKYLTKFRKQNSKLTKLIQHIRII